MRRMRIVLPLLMLMWSTANAQDFGVMESAETVNKGNFKLRVNPLVFFGKGGADDEVGVAGLVGYGFGRRFDVEGGVSISDGIQTLGGTAEFNVLASESGNFSVIPGMHVRRGDRTVHTTGFDLLFLGSTRATPKLDIYGGLDMAFERSEFVDWNTFHIVPGLEYKIHRDVELLVEAGLGLNDDSWHYISGGLAFYFR